MYFIKDIKDIKDIKIYLLQTEKFNNYQSKLDKFKKLYHALIEIIQ